VERLSRQKIEFSKNDIKRGLKLPERLTPALAEDIGIMVGDGNIGFFTGLGHGNYEVGVTGNMITDYHFLSRYVKGLKLKLFGLGFYFQVRPAIKTCRLRMYSKGLVNFYNKTIGLPLGSKKNVGIPDIILNSDIINKKFFLRGLADTDMTLIFKRVKKDVLHYPVIKLGTVSINLVLHVKKMLEDIGFGPSISLNMEAYHTKAKKTYRTHQLYLNGKRNLQKWVQEIGFKNPKNLLRYNLWKNQGFSLPNNDIEKIMNGPEGIFCSAVPRKTAVRSNPRLLGFSDFKSRMWDD